MEVAKTLAYYDTKTVVTLKRKAYNTIKFLMAVIVDIS
jgi:hypothetical protein